MYAYILAHARAHAHMRARACCRVRVVSQMRYFHAHASHAFKAEVQTWFGNAASSVLGCAPHVWPSPAQQQFLFPPRHRSSIRASGWRPRFLPNAQTNDASETNSTSTRWGFPPGADNKASNAGARCALGGAAIPPGPMHRALCSTCTGSQHIGTGFGRAGCLVGSTFPASAGGSAKSTGLPLPLPSAWASLKPNHETSGRRGR